MLDFQMQSIVVFVTIATVVMTTKIVRYRNMNRIDIYVRPHNEKVLKQMDKLRGNTSKSEFILQSIQYMIDTHVKNKDILSPLDLPTLADDWAIWEMYFKDLKIGKLVDNMRKLDQLIRLANREVEKR
jgi:hypothetical protein|tara:strand:+ start:1232 stop:1615 length:384 start_codon:yes stop_codon:yes gene_type:complete